MAFGGMTVDEFVQMMRRVNRSGKVEEPLRLPCNLYEAMLTTEVGRHAAQIGEAIYNSSSIKPEEGKRLRAAQAHLEQLAVVELRARADAVLPWVKGLYVDTPVVRTDGGWVFDELLAILGWQGGTALDALEEVRRLHTADKGSAKGEAQSVSPGRAGLT